MDVKAAIAKELLRQSHKTDMARLRARMGYELRKLFQKAELLPGDRGFPVGGAPTKVFERSTIAKFLRGLSHETDHRGHHLVYIEAFSHGTEGIYILRLDSDPSTWSPDDFVKFLRGGICN